MSTYILVDAMNLFHRAKYVTGGDLDMRVGMALHIVMSSIKKVYRDQKADHIVFCLDGRSWRKDFYKPYKANRVVDRLKRSQKETEEEEVFMEAFNDLSQFFLKNTNATVLHCSVAEADDLIATWIDLHPDDQHIIVSTDTDFVQLLSENVKMFNGVSNQLYAHDGVYNEKGAKQAFEIATNGKVKVKGVDKNFEPEAGWQEFALFLKCIRGDSSDNVFPAYPGARLKGSRNKTGILEAWEDRDNGGFNWNNFMLQRWEDAEGNQQIVRECYQRNRELIDLKAQPEEFKTQFVEAIINEVVKDRVANVGVHFMRFCARWDLQKLLQYPDEAATMLNTPYTGHLISLHKEIQNDYT